MTIGNKVLVKCPAYKNEKRFYGTITGVKKDGCYYVLIDGNKKSTPFSYLWLTLL
jgi:hypothetical protein